MTVTYLYVGTAGATAGVTATAGVIAGATGTVAAGV